MSQVSPDSEEPTRTRADAPQSAWAEPESGLEVVPGYRIERLLARGGMGTIYVARDLALGRRVVLKSTLVTTPKALARFKTEAEAMARLRHPHVLGVHEFGLADGKPYLVLPYVEGESLGDRLRRIGSVPPREAARLMAHAARGVGAAHEAGVLHRDLKPDNLLINDEGRVLVCDFGLAKDLEAEAKLTQTGQILGTPAYFPPEQAQGVLDRVGPRSDVYSLGATLYALLTGQPPFEEDTVFNLLVAVASNTPTLPSHLVDAVDAQLEAICMRCLEKQPEARYPSADALAEALEAWLSGCEPPRRKPLKRFGFVGLLVAVSLIALGLAISHSPGSSAPSLAAGRRERPVDPASSPKPMPSAIAGRELRRLLKQPRFRVDHLRCHGVLKDTPGFALVYGEQGVDRVDLLTGMKVAHWKLPNLRAGALASRTLYVMDLQRVWRLDVGDPQALPVEIFRSRDELFDLDASEGGRVVVADWRTLVVLDGPTGRVLGRYGPQGARVNVVQLQGDALYSGCGQTLDTQELKTDYALRRWNLKTGNVDLELAFGARVMDLHVSPSGTDFGVAANVEQVLLFDAATAIARLTLSSKELPALGMRPARTHRGLARGLAFSPDGRFVVTVGNGYGGHPPGKARLWRVSNGEELWSSSLAPAFLWSATFLSQTSVALANDAGMELYDLRGLAELTAR